MKHLLTGIVAFVIFHVSFGQKAPAKFGDVSMEDLKMKTYEPDSSADAVVLVDFGESAMNYTENKGFVLEFERLTRIKILTKEGQEWGNFQIPLYRDGSDGEKISGLKAVTYNLENGKIVESKLKSEGIFKEKFDENIDIMKVTLPNVREGSVVEITYKVFSDFLVNFQDWEFQNTIPTVWSEYRARIPEYFNYDKYQQGYVPFAVNETSATTNSITFNHAERSSGTITQTRFETERVNYQENRFRWAAKDVPAFKEEPFITTSKDYISKINFELAYIKYPNSPIKPVLGTWEEINKKYNESEDFGGQVRGNGFLKKIVEECIAGKTTPEEKIASIYSFVRTNVSWDGSTRKFVNTPLKKVLEDKKGNTAEINLLLASMLDKADINVAPVLLSTRDNGFLRRSIPAARQFNTVICAVFLNDNGYMLLDATDKFLPIGMIPERCLNGEGMAVGKDGFRWVRLTAPQKTRTVVNGEFTLNAAGELSGKLQVDRTGYDAQSSRKKYFSKGEEEYLKDFTGNQSWERKKSEIQNSKELHQSFKEIHELQINDHANAAGNMIYINPFLLSKLESNPFKHEKREYPVDFGFPFDRVYMIRIEIPQGYAIEELPKTKLLMLPENATRFSYNSAQNGNIITISASLQVNKSLFAQTEYQNLREFYNQVVAKHAEQIVLKKN
jgi:hypothetical protein